jgi:hypothetical protein
MSLRCTRLNGREFGSLSGGPSPAAGPQPRSSLATTLTPAKVCAYVSSMGSDLQESVSLGDVHHFQSTAKPLAILWSTGHEESKLSVAFPNVEALWK